MTTKRTLNNLYIDGSFRYGCIEMQDVSTMSLNTANFIGSSDRGELSFLAQAILDDPWKGYSHWAVRMFRLPDGQAEFERVQEWFGSNRRERARLPEGIPFEKSALAIKSIPAGWDHTAYPRSCRDFVHIYRGGDQAMLVRVSGQRGKVLDNPLLRLIPERLCIVPGQWETAGPKVRYRDELANTKCRWLTSAEYAEIKEMCEHGFKHFERTHDAEGLPSAEAIHQYVELLRSSKLEKGRAQQIAPELGCLWGEVLAQGGRWKWKLVTFGSGDECLALFNQAGTHALASIVILNRILKTKRIVNNLLLVHNLAVAERLPPVNMNGIAWLN